MGDHLSTAVGITPASGVRSSPAADRSEGWGEAGSDNDGAVLYSGWLSKQGGVFQTWKKRHFQLMSGGKLKYYRKEAGAAAAIGDIRLHGATVSKNFTADPAGILEVRRTRSQPTLARP
jgi:hypothetical protein